MILSPLRLPVPPRPRGAKPLNYKAFSVEPFSDRIGKIGTSGKRRPETDAIPRNSPEPGSLIVHAMGGLAGRAGTANNGPGGQLPTPGAAARLTAIIIAGMLVNELHWIGWWLLVTLSGNS